MTVKPIITIFILLFSIICNAQDITSQVKKGKVLEVKVTPIGDAYTNPYDEFTLKLKLVDTVYNLELCKNNVISNVILTEEQTFEVITFFENWKASRCRLGGCGLTYSFVCLNIGHKKKKFRDGFYYCHEIIDDYFNTANIN